MLSAPCLRISRSIRGGAVDIASGIALAPRASVAIRRVNFRPVEQHVLVIGAPQRAARGQRAERVPVIGEAARDDFFPRRVALHLVVEDRELDRHLHRLGAAAGEEEAVHSRRGPSGEPLHQLLALGRNPYRNDVVETAHRVGGEIREFLAPLPDIDHDRAAARVEDFAAVPGEEIRTLGPLDMERMHRAAHEQNLLFRHGAILGARRRACPLPEPWAGPEPGARTRQVRRSRFQAR